MNIMLAVKLVKENEKQRRNMLDASGNGRTPKIYRGAVRY